VILPLERQTAGTGVRRRIEGIQRDDAIECDGQRALVSRRRGQLEQLAGRVDVGVIRGDDRLVFLDRAGPIVQLSAPMAVGTSAAARCSGA
jgi:hypothetical protein